MERFVKNGIKKPYISAKPKRQQLYFLYKLIMNRKMFQFKCGDRMLHKLGKLFCCCRKASFIQNRCSKKFAHADKRAF